MTAEFERVSEILQGRSLYTSRIYSEKIKEAVLTEIELRRCRHNNPLNGLVPDAISPSSDYIQASLYCPQDSSDVRPDKTSEKPDASNLEGSPLKLHDYQKDFKTSDSSEDCDVTNRCNDVKPALPQIKGLPEKRARWLISLYNLACVTLSEGKTKLPLVVVCDGNNTEHLAYIVSHVQPQIESSNDVKVYRYDSYTVTVSDSRLEKSKFPTIDSLIGKPFLVDPYSTEYSAEYELVGDSLDCVSSVEVGGRISAEFKWNKSSSLLSSPHLSGTATLNVIVRPEDPRSPLNNVYKDLCTIQGLVEGIQEGRITWSVKENVVSISSRIKLLVQGMKGFTRHVYYLCAGLELQHGDQKQAVQSESSDTGVESEEERIKLPFLFRQDLDFTEKLWNILKDCLAFNELKECLQIVLDSLSSKTIQPMVHNNNDTQLAKLVRESYYGRMSVTSVQQINCVEVLVEIGLDKLLRDYSYALIGMELVTAHHLKPFVTTCADKLPLHSRVTLMEKLHFVVELVTMMHQYIELPKKNLSCAARMALKHYTNNSSQSGDRFSVPVPAVSVSTIMKNPSVWRGSYTAERREGHVMKSVLLTNVCPLTHLQQYNITGMTLNCYLRQKGHLALQHLPKELKADNENSPGYYLTIVEHCVDIL